MTLDLPAAIEDFWTARLRGESFPRAYFGQLSLDDAYRIQLALIDRRVAAGEQHIGWKVGLTAKAIQEQFGFHEPVFGCILESVRTGHVFRPAELINPGFETELCLKLRKGLEGGATPADVLAAIEAVHPALEIVETRGDLVKHMAVGLADNAQQRSTVIGAAAPFTAAMALDLVTARVRLNGREIAAGSGSAVLGNPLNSILWLAKKLDRYGRSLRPGDIVMTGSFVRQFPLAPGDAAAADFSGGIGGVEVRIAKE